ncbi:MAG: ABC transporter ATP-binding protein [Opitutaceae bacterium]
MSRSIIEVENLSKRYKLGSIGSTSLREEFARRWDSFNLFGRKAALEVGKGPLASQEFWALRDVSFSIEPGEVLGIIGRNGAGKSTLLKILSRITEPTSGRARLRGRVASLLEVGTGFHPDLTGRENVYLNGAILGMMRSEIRRKFDEIVSFAEIERFIDTPVKRYSSGMYVRLAFAVAAHLEPEILIVDEVLAVGDASFQKKCIGKIHSISSDRQRTVIFVSHNMQAMEHLSTRILYLDQGKVAGYGTASAMINEYLRRAANERENARSGELADGLLLSDFQFSPNPVTVGDPVKFAISLASRTRTTIHDFHLVINDPSGFRVAMVDLRDAAGPYVIEPGQRLSFEGDIAKLPLVGGGYGVGLVLRTGNEHQEFSDRFHLEVRPPLPRGKLVPYATQYQGTTALDYTFKTSGAKIN